AGTAVGALETLRKQLDLAVAHEDFEQAVRLRDHIRQLQSDPDHAVPNPEM
ncbi:UvrB/UvrC motif-containing protein, partial [Candidatus Sumerlaeota bacterium]|nr:UvrB/UvrC motif-containing protein [Candidatus Sumerlaeota bacterium]